MIKLEEVSNFIFFGEGGFNIGKARLSWWKMLYVGVGFTHAVVPMYEGDIPLGYLIRSPVTYHTVIYHSECDRRKIGTTRVPVSRHITLKMVYHGVICHGERK